MSGTEATGSEAAVTPTPDAGAAPSTSAEAAPATTGDDPFGDLPEQQAVFDRSYVERVRREGQRYRQDARTARDQLGTYEDVFGVYEQADRDVWLNLARQWVDDPTGAASVMQQIANAVLGEGAEPAVDASSDQPTGSSADGATTGTLTNEQIAQMVQEQIAAADYNRRQEAMVESIYSTMRNAGIEPKSADGMAVLWIANNDTDGDIDKAIEVHKSSRQKAVDEFVASRGGKPLPAPANGVVANANAAPITNLDDARKAADAYLRSAAESR